MEHTHTGEQRVYWVADVGGTKVRQAIISGDGVVLAKTDVRTEEFESPADWVKQCLGWWASQPWPGQAIGVSIAASVDAAGTIVTIPKIPAWQGFPLAESLRRLSGLSTAIVFDATAALMGELWAVPGLGPNVALFAIGTGIGGALSIDGRVCIGAHGLSGMPAMTLPGLGGGVRAEDVASGPAVAQQLGVASGVEAIRLYEANDKRALEVFSKARLAVHHAISIVTGVADVTCVVIAGGFGLAAYPIYFAGNVLDPKYIEYPVVHNDVRLTPARTGLDAQLLGAARSAALLVADSSHRGRLGRGGLGRPHDSATGR